MRSILLTTRLGGPILRLRQWLALRRVPSTNPEAAGMIANDILTDRLMIDLCKTDAGFLDVGAHIGSVFSRVARRAVGIAIYAVEADPEKASALRSRFPGIQLFDCAVGETEGTAEFYRNETQSGYNSLNPDEAEKSTVISVSIKRLDDLLPTQNIDFVKIDIEGAELGALRGAQALIDRNRPTITFESVRAGTNGLGYAPEDIWDFFTDRNYDVLTPDRVAHDAQGLSRESFLDGHIYPRRTHNYFAVAQDRRAEIRDRARKILKIQSTSK